VVEALVGLGDLERGITRSLHGTAAPAEFSRMLRALSTVAPKLGVKVCAAIFCSASTESCCWCSSLSMQKCQQISQYGRLEGGYCDCAL
jgi:hypothetical protein